MTRDFAAELAELRRVYVASLPGKLDEIAVALGKGDLADARNLAHRLRGTAGSYGVTDAGKAFGAIEDRIDAAGGDTSPATLSDLDHLLAKARAVIEGLP